MQGGDVSEAVAINRSQSLVILENDVVIKFEKMWDAFGEETRDCSEAVSAIYPLSDGRWVALDLTAFDPVASH